MILGDAMVENAMHLLLSTSTNGSSPLRSAATHPDNQDRLFNRLAIFDATQDLVEQ